MVSDRQLFKMAYSTANDWVGPWPCSANSPRRSARGRALLEARRFRIEGLLSAGPPFGSRQADGSLRFVGRLEFGFRPTLSAAPVPVTLG